MKFLMMMIVASALPLAASADTLRSEKREVSIARVTQVVSLAKPQDQIQVNVAVEDTGGSTDVSPTQVIYLNLYEKGEMFSVEASFKLAQVLDFRGARRVADGIYDVKAQIIGDNMDYPEVTYRVDARHAKAKMLATTCENEFDCRAANDFSSHIEMVRK